MRLSAIINTKISDEKINISDNYGNFRAIGKFNNGIIIGRYQNKYGEYYNFKMSRDSLFSPFKKQENDIDIDSVIPKSWYPNKAFGFENMPKQKNILFQEMLLFGQMKKKEFY